MVGEQLVQGLDYAYTLQGWLKGVNSTGATSLHDMGGDGRNTGVDTLNRYTARDVYGYTLNYFDGEYKPINTGVNPFPSNAVTFGSTDYRPLYNGNISSMASNIRQFSDPSMQGGPILLYNYTYDQLNRLKAMDVYNSYNSSTNSWSASSKLAAFAERITYDGNGNILKYFRNGAADNAFPGYQATIDSLSYKYYPNTNRLQRVIDTVPYDKLGVNSWEFIYDIDSQKVVNNYQYDSIGNLISDAAEKISYIKWSVYGKILEIVKTDSVTNHVFKIQYKYDAMGNRIGKVVSKYNSSTRDFTWYVRDAQGNIMATYTSTGTAVDTSLNLLPLGTNERYIYGSSRLGMERWYVTTDGSQLYDMRWYSGNTFRRGYKNYELSNHLGNVLATISDKKKGVPLANSSLIDYFEADLQTAQDYYPFGMLMPHRSYASTANYRFGFNGKENDNELKGLGNQQDYGMRVYDSRLGKFLSTDPVNKSYESPYSSFANNPINVIDPDGADTININKTTTIRSIKGSNDGHSDNNVTPNRAIITQTGEIVIKQAEGNDVFIITNTTIRVDEYGNEKRSVTSTTLELNDPQTFYRTGGHKKRGYNDDRYALAAHAPTWLLEHYAVKSGDIGVRSAIAYQKDVPFVAGLGQIMEVAYLVSGAYGLLRGTLFSSVTSETVGYNSMREFTEVYGAAPEGMNWHHFVEQRLAKNGAFSPKLIYSTENTVLIQSGAKSPHQAISNFYSSKRTFTNNLTVRKWLEGQTFEFQLKYGKDIYNRVMNGTPLPN